MPEKIVDIIGSYGNRIHFAVKIQTALQK